MKDYNVEMLVLVDEVWTWEEADANSVEADSLMMAIELVKDELREAGEDVDNLEFRARETYDSEWTYTDGGGK